LGEPKRDALADAFAAAGDEGGLAGELEIHSVSPVSKLGWMSLRQRPVKRAARFSANALRPSA
jgi:hypothetical protein